MVISRSWLGVGVALIGLLQAPMQTSGAQSTPAVRATTAKPVILVFGDSLSAGYNISVGATWVALLERRLTQQGYGYRVVNASVSGETTGGGRARLPRALAVHRPAVVILELGGNDGLRGLPVPQIRGNLQTMLEQIERAGAKAVLVGIQIPTNYGSQYAERFRTQFADLARQHDAALVEFFLERVALDPKLMQDDGIHPNTAAQPILLDTLWPAVRSVLKKTTQER